MRHFETALELVASEVRFRFMNKAFSVISLVAMATLMFFSTASACSSGIEGTVTLGPTCPVERPGMTCEKPYAASIDVYTESGHFVKTVRSAADGGLRVNLRPGIYTLKPQPRDPARPYPIGKPVTVTVKPGSFEKVTIQYDTGIR
jgi:hypothetical protein